MGSYHRYSYATLIAISLQGIRDIFPFQYNKGGLPPVQLHTGTRPKTVPPISPLPCF